MHVIWMNKVKVYFVCVIKVRANCQCISRSAYVYIYISVCNPPLCVHVSSVSFSHHYSLLRMNYPNSILTSIKTEWRTVTIPEWMGVQREKEEGTIAVRNMNEYQREHRRKRKVMGVNEYNYEENERCALMVRWGEWTCRVKIWEREKIRVNNIH